MFEIIPKVKVVDLSDEILPPCWIERDIDENLKENNYFESTQIIENVWLSGRDEILLNELKNAIINAKEMVCLSSYIFSESQIKDALIFASYSGVRVYMITASNKHLKSQPEEDDDFNLKMYSEMDQLFKELQGKVKIRTSEIFHTKFLIIDPLQREFRKGYLLTSNFDTKGLIGKNIRGIYRVNPEICVRLTDEEIDGLFNQFCYGFWELSMEESKIDGFLSIRNKIKKEINLASILINSDSIKSLKNSIINLIKENPGRLVICSYGISDDNAIYDCLLEEIENGREIIILTRPRQRIKHMNALIKLVKLGATVYGHEDIHAKVILIENENKLNGIIMTANIERVSFESSFESGKFLNNEEAKAILMIIKKWIKDFPLLLNINLRRNQANNKIWIWDDEKNSIQIKEVVDEEIIETEPKKKPRSIINYKEFEISNDDLEKPSETNKIFKKLTYKYNVKPPILPNSAKEYNPKTLNKESGNSIKNDTNLPVYKAKGRIFIVIKESSELKDAQALAKKLRGEIVTLNKYIKN